MSAWALPLGGDVFCPDLIPAGGGEQKGYEGIARKCQHKDVAASISQHGVGVGSGGPDGAAARFHPLRWVAHLFFWSLRKR